VKHARADALDEQGNGDVAGRDDRIIGFSRKHVYVANNGNKNPSPNNVSVIETTGNTVMTTVAVGRGPSGVAVTPDGKHVYVSNNFDKNVSVIETTGNTVMTTVAVGSIPFGVGIIPPPVGVPFLAFSARLQLDIDANPAGDALALESSFTLGMTAPAINPLTQAVSFQVGPFSATIPAGQFKQFGPLFSFTGVISGVNVQALIAPTGTMRYAFAAAAEHPNLTGTKNPVPVTLTIGNDTGMKSVNAIIFH